MNIPKNLRYTKEHEWAKLEGTSIRVGITDHAQSSLGDIVFVDLPSIGKELKAGEPFGVVESVKAVSDLYSPLSGKVSQVNQELLSDPSLLNKDPYGQAWIVELTPSDPSQLEKLLDSKSYEDFIKSLG